MRVSEAFEVYDIYILQKENRKLKTRKNYQCAINSFIKGVGDIPVELVCLDHITRWELFMNDKGDAPDTKRHNVIRFRKLLRFLKERNVPVMDTDSIKIPEKGKSRVTFLVPDEVQRMIDAAKNPRDKAIIACLFSTACRISELLGLNVEDVRDNDEPEVCGKGDKYKTVFIDRTARKYLNEYLATRTDNYKPLFMSGQRRRITVQRVEQIIHECAHEAGLDKNVTPHVLRHSTITDYIVKGAPMAIVQKIAGHKNIQTTIDIYTHLDTADMRNVFKKFHERQA